MERITKTEAFATACYVASIVFAIILAASFSGCGGCDDSAFGGSCIGIGDEPVEEAPTCEVTDECVGEVVLDLCPPVVEAEACPPPRVEVIIVYADPDTDECDLTVPVGHRPIECRGKDHAK